MAATKFSVGVVISAVDKASAVFGHVKRGAASLTSGLGRVAGALTSTRALVGGVLTGMAAQKVLEFGKSYVDAASEINDFTKQVGWSSEALQVNRYAAQQLGVEVEEFDKNIAIMGRNLGAARLKTGSLFSALSKGAPTLLKQALAAKSSSDAYEILINGVRGLSNEQDRSAALAAIFGRGGMAMARIVNTDAKEVGALTARLRTLGGVIDDEAIAAADKFGDDLVDLKVAAGGVGNLIMRQLVPSLDKTTGSLTEWIVKNRELIAGKVVEFVGKVGDKLRALGAWLETKGPTLWEHIENGAKVVDAVGWAIGKLLTLAESSEFSFTTMATAFGAAMAAMAGNPAFATVLAGVAAINALNDVQMSEQERITKGKTGVGIVRGPIPAGGVPALPGISFAPAGAASAPEGMVLVKVQVDSATGIETRTNVEAQGNGIRADRGVRFGNQGRFR